MGKNVKKRPTIVFAAALESFGTVLGHFSRFCLESVFLGCPMLGTRVPKSIYRSLCGTMAIWAQVSVALTGRKWNKRETVQSS